MADTAIDTTERGSGMFDKGLILGPGPAPRCDDFRLGGPVVRWDDKVSRWRMWYYCRATGFADDVAPAFGTGSVATALSEDGLSWQRQDHHLEGGAVLRPSTDQDAFDSSHVAVSDVIRHDGRWLMAYFGGSAEIPEGTKELYAKPGYRMRLGIAESPDGIHWSRIAGNAPGGAVLDVAAGDVYVAFPGLVATDDGFLMHYTTVDNHGRFHRTHVVRSDDLQHWSETPGFDFDADPPLHESAGIVTRDIVANPTDAPERWLMVYTARDGRSETAERRSICAAVSDDLLAWRRLPQNPCFTVGPQGAWDSGGVANPRLVATADALHLYYFGWSNPSYADHPGRGIGCAVGGAGRLDNFKRI